MEDMFREWSSRRPWKERKRATKARERASSHLARESDPPELIFYGRNSGVVGLKKSELYQTVLSSEFLSHGYDKVKSSFFSFTCVYYKVIIYFLVQELVFVYLCIFGDYE